MEKGIVLGEKPQENLKSLPEPSSPSAALPEKTLQNQASPLVAESDKPFDPSQHKQIDEFRGAHYFLSNSAPSPIVYEGVRYPTVDHAYTAAQTTNETDRRQIAAIENPVAAKRAAQVIETRPDWEKVRVDILLTLIREKFQNEREKSRLLATGNATLLYNNTQGDQALGIDRKTGFGENELGNILMRVRDEITRGIDPPQAQHDTPHEAASPNEDEKNATERDAPHVEEESSPQSPFVIESPKADKKPTQHVLSGMTSRIHENGDISYRFNDLRSRALGKDAFRDCGSTIRLEDKDDRSIRAAVQYAKESWGNESVILRVAPEVRDTVLREAVKIGLKVQNPELQGDIERLKAERSKSLSGRHAGGGTISRAPEREQTPSR